MDKIIKSRRKLPILSAEKEQTIPVLPIRSAVIFPSEIHTLQIGRRENLALIDAVTQKDNLLVLSFIPKQTPNGGNQYLSQVGVLTRIQSVKEAIAGSRMVTLEGVRRIALAEIKNSEPFLTALVAELAEGPDDSPDLEKDTSEIIELISKLTRLDTRYAGELIYTLGMSRSSPSHFTDRVAAMIHFQLHDKQEILESITIPERCQTILRKLKTEIENTSTLARINDRVTESLERKKKESFLRQQLMEIRRELGDDFIEEDIAKHYHKKIKENRSFPKEVSEYLLSEADRLKHLSSSSAEYGSSKYYLDLVLSLPWEPEKKEIIDLKKVEESLNTGYYGLSKIKEQILEYLALRTMSKDHKDLPILCLIGAIGTGKASLAKAMAASLGRKFVRINGTSLIEVEDIKGTYRTDIGAGPGHLIRILQSEKSSNLVIFIEDLEYVVESEDTNALLSLLEAIDPRQNRKFVDTFIGIPIDLSRVLFVLSITGLEEFPEPFTHRLEIVEMPGYIEKEKIIIAKKHILPKLYKKHGLARTEFKFNDKILIRIIRQYTMEAGLIGLQQQLKKIFRRIARKKAMGDPCKITLTENTIDEFLGTPQFIPEKAMTEPEIGVANGLAWTGAGGDLMLIEGLKMKGTGTVATTGLLGEIMKESIQAAHSFIRSRADILGIDHDDFANFDIHIHFPMGAIPKDGPSAGTTVAVVLASVMAERPVRSDIAMTGEVTLRGKIIPVGGVKEKVSAANRAGIFTIILPKENKKDIKELPREIIRKTKFIFIDTVDELLEHALLDFQPSTYTLEKLFAEEIEKAKKRKRSRSKSTAEKKTTKANGAKTKKRAPKKIK
ncbi:MAG: endopeptidase La [Candidatus Zixiibacteriota bacterium]